MKPRFTDTVRYPHGYTRSEATDIRKTFARARSRQKPVVEEPTARVQQIPQRRKA